MEDDGLDNTASDEGVEREFEKNEESDADPDGAPGKAECRGRGERFGSEVVWVVEVNGECGRGAQRMFREKRDVCCPGGACNLFISRNAFGLMHFDFFMGGVHTSASGL